MLNRTEHKYINETPRQDTDFADPVEGLQYAVIRKAEWDQELDKWKIGLHSLTNGAYINLTFNLTNMDQNGNEEPNARNRRTLISLTKALYGPDEEGLPYPDDIIGCAVLVDVKKSVSKTRFKDVTVTDEQGNTVTVKQPFVFWNVYDFKPVPEGVAKGFGNPEQYSLPETVEETEAGDIEE